jgi:hypothetical protein
MSSSVVETASFRRRDSSADGAVLDAVEGGRGRPVRRQGRLVPDGLELLHEIAGGDHLDSQLPNPLHCTGVDTRDVRNGAARRVLQGQPAAPGHERRQAAFELTPPGIGRLPARERVEVVTFDCVHERSRFTRSGNQIEPAPGRHLARAVEPRQARRNRVGAVEVVEQPSVESLGAERALDRRHIQRHAFSITPACRDLCHSRRPLNLPSTSALLYAWTKNASGKSCGARDAGPARMAI